MSLSLSSLKSAKRKKGKRRGRGDASGSGTYSGRGQKGQRSRSGGRKNLKRKGLKQMLQQIPKKRGFKSFYPSLAIVNLDDLDKSFANGEMVTLNKMIKVGLIKNSKKRVKILADGRLSKKLTVLAHGFSKKAEDAINKSGGQAQIIK